MEKKIVLNEEEIEVIEKQISGKLDTFDASDREKEVIGNVIDAALEYYRSMETPDDLDGDLVLWYYNKYKAQ